MLTAAAKAAHLRLGRRGENAAAKLLTAYGGVVLARNWRCRAGELDLVALDGTTLVFIEVKTLRVRAGFTPGMNLSARQRRRNFHAARVYCGAVGNPRLSKRFDLVEVSVHNSRILGIEWHRDYWHPGEPL